MGIKIETLKKIGQNIEVKKSQSNIKTHILSILKKSGKDGDSLTQKEISEKVGKILNRDIRPQHVRSVLLSLRKNGKVVRRVLNTPDEGGNTHFWYLTKL